MPRCQQEDCGAEVVFVRHHTTGGRMVLDAKSVPDGEWGIVNGQCVPRALDDEGPWYRTHFVTCTNPERFRR